jgi:nucleoside-diphosphate-sugar epimerase
MVERIGVLGARSPIGRALLASADPSRVRFDAFTRGAPPRDGVGVTWRRLPASGDTPGDLPRIERWISLVPIGALPEWFSLLAGLGANRVVALSSTSVFTKQDSSDARERDLVERLAAGEAALRDWAGRDGVDWTILRPTLVYGAGDRNIAAIARFVRRYRFFPLASPGKGLRQPVHAQDVANACLAGLRADAAQGRCYALSGADTLTYREMVERVFVAAGRRVRFLEVRPSVLGGAVAILRRLPGFAAWSPAMIERMNRDLVFDHADACRDLGFQPRPFRPDAADWG